MQFRHRCLIWAMSAVYSLCINSEFDALDGSSNVKKPSEYEPITRDSSISRPSEKAILPVRLLMLGMKKAAVRQAAAEIDTGRMCECKKGAKDFVSSGRTPSSNRYEFGSRTLVGVDPREPEDRKGSEFSYFR